MEWDVRTTSNKRAGLLISICNAHPRHALHPDHVYFHHAHTHHMLLRACHQGLALAGSVLGPLPGCRRPCPRWEHGHRGGRLRGVEGADEAVVGVDCKWAAGWAGQRMHEETGRSCCRRWLFAGCGPLCRCASLFTFPTAAECCTLEAYNASSCMASAA